MMRLIEVGGLLVASWLTSCQNVEKLLKSLKSLKDLENLQKPLVQKNIYQITNFSLVHKYKELEFMWEFQ